jgi:hypothetical protein
MITTLQLERRDQPDETSAFGGDEQGVVLVTPMVDDDYWAYRVRVSEEQAILGFPKFGTVGVGFAQEEDWNTNLPYTAPTQEIWNHIKHNKGDDAIADITCIEAIEMIQAAVRKDRGEK